MKGTSIGYRCNSKIGRRKGATVNRRITVAIQPTPMSPTVEYFAVLCMLIFIKVIRFFNNTKTSYFDISYALLSISSSSPFEDYNFFCGLFPFFNNIDNYDGN